MDEQDNDLSLTRKIVAFILTLVALPIVFAATCIPLGAAADGWTRDGNILVVVGSYSAIFIAAAIGWAIRTKNPGIRWAIIVQLALAAIGAIAFFAQTGFLR